MSRDILPDIEVTPQAITAWANLCHDVAAHVVRADIDFENIPNEVGEVQDDGTLLIYVDFGLKRLSTTLQPDEWRWKSAQKLAGDDHDSF